MDAEILSQGKSPELPQDLGEVSNDSHASEILAQGCCKHTARTYRDFRISTCFPQKHPLSMSEVLPLKDKAIKNKHAIWYEVPRTSY